MTSGSGIDERLKFSNEAPETAILHTFPNDRIKPLYDDIVAAIVVPAGRDEIDIADALVALAAAVITTISLAPVEYQKSLRSQVVLRIGDGRGVRQETDPRKIAGLWAQNMKQ